jgi:hypothetical protein
VKAKAVYIGSIADEDGRRWVLWQSPHSQVLIGLPLDLFRGSWGAAIEVVDPKHTAWNLVLRLPPGEIELVLDGKTLDI